MTEPDQTALQTRLDTELGMLRRRLHQMAVALARNAQEGLDPGSYAILGALYQSGDDLRGGTLAERFGLDKSTISRQLVQLDELGLIERVPDPQDGRARLIHITERGRARVLQLRALRARWLDRALRDWPEPEVEQLIELLSRLNAVLGTPPPAPDDLES